MEKVLFNKKLVFSLARIRSLIIRKFSCNENKKHKKSEFSKSAFPCFTEHRL